MKLLITQAAYGSNNALAGITSNHVPLGITVNSNTIQHVYCDVTNASIFEQIRPTLNSDSYAYSVDGTILIPRENL